MTYCYDGQIWNGGADGVCVAASPAIPNATGRLTQMRSSASTTTYGSYDGPGRVTANSQFTAGTTYNFGYAYNAASLMTSLVYPSNRTGTTHYDNAARPDKLGLTANAAQYVSAVSYWPHGAINQPTYGSSGVQQTNTYDSLRLQPTNISAGSLLALDYGWCPASDCTKNNGNLASQKVTVGGLAMTQAYGYDKLSRLSSASESAPGQPGWNQGYAYDVYGNRAVSGSWFPNGSQTPQSLSGYIDNTQPAVNTNHWLMQTSSFPSGNQYDAAGNLTKVTNGLNCGTCPQYSYDAENRMIAATALFNTPDTAYVYDGAGRRVQKTQNGTGTTYVYDAMGNLAAEYGTPTDFGTKFLLTDHLGSTRVLVSSNGTSPKRYDYLPFGEEIPTGKDGRGPEYSSGTYPAPAGPQSLEFTGKERDAETGLDYFGARYLSSSLGRFISPDPTFVTTLRISDPQQWNLYTYTRNNPLKYVDPDGHEMKLAFYNSSSLPKSDAVRVADRIVSNLSKMGVKNVTYEVHQGTPGLKAALYELTPTPHSHLLEIRPSREGSPRIRTEEGGHNWDAGGHSAIDASVVLNKATNPTQVEVGLSNLGTHEILHDQLSHNSNPDNIMYESGAADMHWLFNPSPIFTPAQAQAVQNQYNRPGEIDVTPPPPPPPPKPAKQ